jgi:hypothetical protein
VVTRVVVVVVLVRVVVLVVRLVVLVVRLVVLVVDVVVDVPPPVEPVQATPFRANEVGTAFVLPEVPWKPADALPPVARAPFQPALVALTAAPLWLKVAFQPLVIFWSFGNVQVTVQPLIASPRLVTVTPATKPPPHCEAIA